MSLYGNIKMVVDPPECMDIRQANFKVVRLAAATSEIGENVSPAGQLLL